MAAVDLAAMTHVLDPELTLVVIHSVEDPVVARPGPEHPSHAYNRLDARGPRILGQVSNQIIDLLSGRLI
ncbi:MAG TPA: hypothetical protein VMA72_13040 [Streptosporangiaceae bacterium]|nr:hypothetical protein [Streptosporangiaceae bacterium]